MERPIPEICTVTALQPKEGMPFEVIEWELLNLTAVSSTEYFSIYVLGDQLNVIYEITRAEFGKNFVRKGSICYMDWGFGITPNIIREQSKCLLAIAWDKVLQVLILKDPNQGMSGVRLDGYYISDYPIDKVVFVADSVLMILVNMKEVRILFVPNLSPGSFFNEGAKIKEIEDK